MTTKWEYMSVPVNENCMFWEKNADNKWISVPMTYLGFQGWELVYVTVRKEELRSYGEAYVAFLKRQVS